MVRIDSIETSFGNVQKVNLFADDISELADVDMETGETEMDIVGYDTTRVKLTQGSMAMDGKANTAFLLSDGTWSVV